MTDFRTLLQAVIIMVKKLVFIMAGDIIGTVLNSPRCYKAL